MTSRHRHVVHVDEVTPTRLDRAAHAFTRRQLGAAAGGRGLGCSHMEVPPGKTAWPRHYHAANEEALFVLAGEGTLRLGDAEITVRAGDYVALPPGPDAAHQLTNHGQETLCYLALSTMLPVEVTVYPDSAKVGVMAGAGPGGNKQERYLERALPLDAAVDYWKGEG